MKSLIFGVVAALALSGCGILVDFAGDEKEKAWIYKHVELGTYLYCDSDQGNPKDYEFIGTGKFKSDKVESCSLAQ